MFTEAKPRSLSEHHFQGLTNPDVNRKRMHQLFCYMTLSLFYFHIINLLKSVVPRKIISTIYFPNFCNSYEISKIIAF